jgi:hypothetical protein
MILDSGTHMTTTELRAQRARELAWIHNAVCRFAKQLLACSTCRELNAAAARYVLHHDRADEPAVPDVRESRSEAPGMKRLIEDARMALAALVGADGWPNEGIPA